MTDLPWLPLWVQDFRSSRSVRRMSLEAVGLYTLLLCEQWDGGPLPDDVDEIAALCGRPKAQIEDAWDEVRDCFEPTENGLVNPRLERERTRQIKKRARRVEAGKKGAASRWGSTT